MNNSSNFTDSQENILALNKFFHLRLLTRPYWNILESGEPVLYDCGVRKNGEPRIIEPPLYSTERNTAAHRDLKKTWRMLQGFRDIMTEREPTDEELRHYLKIVKDSWALLQICKSDGSTKWVPGRAKGTATYNQELKEKLETFASLWSQKRYIVLFFNFTCDPHQYKNRADAWKNYKKKNVDPTIEYLRKHFGAKYEGVIESHANGYPHAHYIVWLPIEFFPELAKIKNGKEIKYGRFYKELRKRIPNRIFKVIKAGGKRVVGYLCKYINKGIENDIFNVLTSDEELTKTQRKEIIEFLALKAFNRRQVYLQNRRTYELDEEEEEEEEVSVSQQSASESEPLTATKLRAHLIKICTNSPNLYYKTIYSMSYGSFIDRYKVPPQKVKEVPQEVAEDFKKNSTEVFNSHNFYNDFVAFCLDWENSPLNRKFYWGDSLNNYSRMCDGYDFNNDEEYLECVTMVFDYYATQILINHNSYADVLAGKENLTDTRRVWKLRNGLEYEAQENNACDNFISYEEKQRILKTRHRRLQSQIARNLYEEKQLKEHFGEPKDDF